MQRQPRKTAVDLTGNCGAFQDALLSPKLSDGGAVPGKEKKSRLIGGPGYSKSGAHGCSLHGRWCIDRNLDVEFSEPGFQHDEEPDLFSRVPLTGCRQAELSFHFPVVEDVLKFCSLTHQMFPRPPAEFFVLQPLVHR